jgi:putative endonuclease
LNGCPDPLVENGSNWQVYMILCSDATFYTGITTDVARRFAQHARGRGARYFRGRSPRRVVFLEAGHTRSSAARREVGIKKLSRSEKETLIMTPANDCLLLPDPGPLVLG